MIHKTHKTLQRLFSKTILVWPAFIWFCGFIIMPLVIILILSFLKKGDYGGIIFEFSLQNFTKAFDPLYFTIILNSLKLALYTTVLCFLFGFPLAYFIATQKGYRKYFYLVLIMIPFWTNFVVRVYSIKILLGYGGWLSQWIQWIGLTELPMSFTDNQLSVLFAMVLNYLPYMVLPLYVALEKFDFTLKEASYDLGANSFQFLFQIMLPILKPALYSGFILVFIPALGEFVIPDMLGGAKSMMIGNLITDQYLKMRDWPFGSALSVSLIVMVLLGFKLQTYFQKEST